MYVFRFAIERIEKMKEADQLSPKSRFRNWKPVSAEEMEGFMAVIINMGVIQLPEIEAYWSTKWTGEIPFFRRVFARNRFEQIFWMLHVSRDDPAFPTIKIN